MDPKGKRQSFDYSAGGERLGTKTVSSTDSKYRYYTNDANGSVLGLEDEAGAVAPNETYRYDPYGNLETDRTQTDETGATKPAEFEDTKDLGESAQDNPFRFQGHFYDAGIQTYDMHARSYRPQHGRFLSQDRFAQASGDQALQSDPLTQDRYSFAGANPVTNVEFDGHDPHAQDTHARGCFDGRCGGASKLRNQRRAARATGRALRAQSRAVGASVAGSYTGPAQSGSVPLTDTTSSRAAPAPRPRALKPIGARGEKAEEGAVCKGETNLENPSNPACRRALAPGNFDGGNWGSLANMMMTFGSGPGGLGGKKLGKELGEELFKKNADEGGEEVAKRTVTALTREQDAGLRAVMRDRNSLDHIFGQGGKHGLGKLTQELGGQEAVVREAILRVPRSQPEGVFTQYDRIGPHPIKITGNMINGVPRISNVMTPR